MDFEKPLPLQTPAAKPFWEGLKKEEIRLQRCNDCGHWIFYPRNHCTNCLSDSLSWQQVGGRATLYTYTIARQPTAPHFTDEVPQVLAIVELHEGVKLTSTLTEIKLGDIHVGMSLKPYFDHVSDEVTLLRFTSG